MKPLSRDHGRRAAGKALGALLLCALMPTLLAGCGVRLSSGEQKTELFQALTLRGDLVTGGEVTLGVDYSQPYPAAVEIVCDVQTTAKSTPTVPAPATATPVPGVSPTPPAIPKPVPTPKNVVLEILRYTVGPNNSGGSADQATPILSSTSGKFRAPDAPGSYTILCYTPADQDNRITKTIRIEPAATP